MTQDEPQFGNESFRSYYQKELSSLEADYRKFLETNPNLGSELGSIWGNCKGFSTQQIIESVAFMATRLKRQIDSVPGEVAYGLIQGLAPEVLGPIPSMAVIQFEPLTDALEPSLTVADGSIELITEDEINKVYFRIPKKAVKLWPMRLNAITVDDKQWSEVPVELHGADLVLRIDHASTDLSIGMPGELQIYIDGPTTTALAAIDALTLGCESIQCCALNGSWISTLPKLSIKVSGLDGEDRLFPGGREDRQISMQLLEYLSFPQRFAFFRIENLFMKTPGRGFYLGFNVKQQYRQELLSAKDFFRLNCAPATNLFYIQSQTITLSSLQTQYPISRTDVSAGRWDVYQIESVRLSDLEQSIELNESSLGQPRPRGVKTSWQAVRKERLSDSDAHATLELRFNGNRLSQESSRCSLDTALISYYAHQCNAAETLKPSTPLKTPNWASGYRARLLGNSSKYIEPQYPATFQSSDCSHVLGWRSSSQRDLTSRVQRCFEMHSRIDNTHAVAARNTLRRVERRLVAMPWINVDPNLPYTVGADYRISINTQEKNVTGQYVYQEILRGLIGQGHEQNMPFEVSMNSPLAKDAA